MKSTIHNTIEEWVNKEALLKTSQGLSVKVKVISVVERWGKTRFLVTPVEGSGEAWVESLTKIER